MPVTQREWDVMQLESKQKIEDIYEEWRRSFLRGRILEQLQPYGPNQLPPPEVVE